MLGSPILYLKGMRILMFQLSGFYYMACSRAQVPRSRECRPSSSSSPRSPPATAQRDPRRVGGVTGISGLGIRGYRDSGLGIRV